MNRPVVYKFIYVDHAFMSCGLFYPLTIVSDLLFFKWDLLLVNFRKDVIHQPTSISFGFLQKKKKCKQITF